MLAEELVVGRKYETIQGLVLIYKYLEHTGEDGHVKYRFYVPASDGFFMLGSWQMELIHPLEPECMGSKEL